ncbi:Ubiquitin carboxyl-terminal hydrolase 47 [Fasciolopsis buskii]|uniref:Ubiquitin carboxyl-terminal hydrolase 47 n=1 Tax=Fasciolopsis buskii TaxID=27845 RepID=A0A8E0VKB1_9TREM|nr:Ubiquitin carboxyl-terminal hydrolase 47 [Fasciolopsis buski]
MNQETTTSDFSGITTHRSMSANTEMNSAVASASGPPTFVGLMNSGMTCYMNSLLQTLFMTPEFRNALFQWKFEDPRQEAETNIPYQLQRLFVQLCVTSHSAVSPLGLITSFGWQASEVFQQQDIHELCRVMFDALEKRDYMQFGPQRKEKIHRVAINERATFLDIQVPLRPFFLDVSSYSSLDEAFQAMLQLELLDGSNQYYCSHGGKKQDAMLDCVYEQMPYLLSLRLMRLTLDPRTGNPIKLNDRVRFPLEDWDVTKFVMPSTDSYPSTENDSGSMTNSCGAQGDRESFDDDEALVCNLNEDGPYNTTEPVEDEDIDLGTDSGANSGPDSPFGVSSSRSQPHPINGSPSDSQNEVMDHEDGVPDQHPTLTVDQASQLHLPSFTRSMTNPLDTDDDDDNDGGFGTRDTQSACSSVHEQQHDRHPSTLPITGSKTNCVINGAILDRTPTKAATVRIERSQNAGDSNAKSTSKLVYKLFSIVVHSGSIRGGTILRISGRLQTISGIS